MAKKVRVENIHGRECCACVFSHPPSPAFAGPRSHPRLPANTPHTLSTMNAALRKIQRAPKPAQAVLLAVVVDFEDKAAASRVARVLADASVAGAVAKGGVVVVKLDSKAGEDGDALTSMCACGCVGVRVWVCVCALSFLSGGSRAAHI